MKIKTLIIDDEPYAREVLQNYLAGFSDIELLGTCSDGISAFKFLQQNKVDLMFLDIKMPGINGNDLVKSLIKPPKVVFTTAYQDYAVEGFELNAIDYLLKPVPFDRFLKTVDKIYDVFEMNPKDLRLAEKSAGSAPSDFYLYLRVDRKVVKIDTSEILWIESLKDYIKVVLKDRTLISKQKISILEQMLPEESFLRVHRSFIVSVSKIDSFSSTVIEISGRSIPIGRNYKLDLQRKFKNLNAAIASGS